MVDHRSERLRRRAERAVAEFDGVEGWRRQVFARFLVDSKHGWHTFVHRGFPGIPESGPEFVLIGPQGVLAVQVRDRVPEASAVRSGCRMVADLLLGARCSAGNVSEAVVRPVVVLPEQERSTGEHLTLSASELDHVLRRGERRLDRRDVRALVEHLAAKTAEYAPVSLPEDATEESGQADAGLLDVGALRQDRFDQALSGPFESWLTFLDDSQSGMAKRHYNGPARISGPAGTGKSVVALHRLVYLGRRSVDPLLFTTYARNLPPIVRKQFERLAPELADRAEFTTLHGWALGLLRARGRSINVDRTVLDTCFNRAWAKIGQGSELERIEPSRQYWRDEIDRVIKGRGLADVGEYQDLDRLGRGRGLDRGAARERMWAIYRRYEEIRREKGVHDFNDVILEALAEIRREPHEPAYSAVVVDEVQDITLVGLRLLHELAGDGPNGLLMVGDGQQQIYSGGWRLSDAGIPIRGRGEVLRSNYRNASKILDLAKELDATNQVDDLDGNAGFSLREAVATLRGGNTTQWRGPRTEHRDALIAAIPDDVEPDDIAVLTFRTAEVAGWIGALNHAGFPASALENYYGDRDGTIKVGTVFRAKGLEFRAVLVPELPGSADGNGSARAVGSVAEREWRERGERARLVAITRARDQLWIGHPEQVG